MELFGNSVMFLNLILMIILVFYIIRGYKKGAVKQFFSLFSLIIALFFAYFFYIPFGQLFKVTPAAIVPFQGSVLEGFFYIKVNSLVWFLILFITGFIFMQFLKVVFNLFSKVPGISFINKVSGVAFGVFNYVIVSLIIIFFLSMPIFTNGPSLINNSLLNPSLKIGEKVIPRIANDLENYELFNVLMNNPKQASVDDVLRMQKYLEDNNVSLDKINEFMMEIKKW